MSSRDDALDISRTVAGMWLALAVAILILLFNAPAARGGSIGYRVATDYQGNQAAGRSSGGTVSWDGRFVVFESAAPNLVPGDTNGVSDIFFKDTANGLITRISTSPDGSQLNGRSWAPKMTPDGHYVSFQSAATNLVPGDNNAVEDVFVLNVWTGQSALASASSGGAPGNAVSELPTISTNGRFVAYRSQATNLVPGDTNGVTDVFVRDTWSNTTTRVSTSSAGNQANGQSGVTYGAWMAGGGSHVVFESDADNLVPGDTNGARDIFVKDLATGETTRVSTSGGGSQADGGNYAPSISANGRYVAFRSTASNLVQGDTLMCGAFNCSDVFVKDVATGRTYWMSVSDTGAPANSPSWDPMISPDGNFLGFSTNASNLVPGDTNGTYDIYVKDLRRFKGELVSKTALGALGNGWSIGPMFSYNGNHVVFYSDASNLVSGDTNNAAEVLLSRSELASS